MSPASDATIARRIALEGTNILRGISLDQF